MSTKTSDQDSLDLIDTAEFAFTRRAWVDAAPVAVYDLVSDVSMIAHWSPDASEVAYDQNAGPQMGAWFSGRNRKEGREWTTRSQVTDARPGESFAFVVGGADSGIVQWCWSMQAHGGGTVVTQSWTLLRMDPVLGTTRGEVTALRDYMADSAETTLVALARWVNEHPPAAQAEPAATPSADVAPRRPGPVHTPGPASP